MNRGIVYWLVGDKYAELLAVSLWSLRRHWSGPVQIFVGDVAAAAVCVRMAENINDMDVTISGHDLPNTRRHAHYVAKPGIALASPFERSIFLDADTLVCGPLDGLWTDTLKITRFAGWLSTGKIISGRIKQWSTVSPYARQLVGGALSKEWPAINTGVFAWGRNYSGLRAWEQLTLAGQRCSFTDEVALQILYPALADSDLVDDRWNCSPLYGLHRPPNIWHFHGRGHVRKNQGREIWLPALREAMAENFAGLGEWAGQYDDAVKAALGAEVQ